jgi:hypothetical protein
MNVAEYYEIGEISFIRASNFAERYVEKLLKEGILKEKDYHGKFTPRLAASALAAFLNEKTKEPVEKVSNVAGKYWDYLSGNWCVVDKPGDKEKFLTMFMVDWFALPEMKKSRPAPYEDDWDPFKILGNRDD